MLVSFMIHCHPCFNVLYWALCSLNDLVTVAYSVVVFVGTPMSCLVIWVILCIDFAICFYFASQ